MKASEESEWIPKDHYSVNDWVSDVCNFLRFGHKQAERDAVRECEEAAAIYCNAESVVQFIRNRYPQHFKGGK